MLKGQLLIRRIAAGFIIFNLVIIYIALRSEFEGEAQKSLVAASLTNQPGKQLGVTNTSSGKIGER